MRFLARRQKPALGRATSRTQDVPAPIGGLNTRDSLGAMEVTDALELVNWIPQSTGLVSRKGYEESNADYTDTIETIIPYIQGTTRYVITAAGDELFYDTGSAETSLGTGFGNARWRAAKIAANMVLVNGQDAPRNFDGTTLTTPSITGDLALYGEENINGIHLHRNRLYMWDTNYPNVFYGGANSVSGGFTEFQLDRVSQTGGNLIEVKSITQDAGDGFDDYIAFILDTGEVLVYQGSDPSDASNWSLVGKYLIPPIIGLNCAVEFGGDILILTKQDLIRLSEVMKYGSETGGFNLQPSKLSGAISTDYATYGGQYGWSLSVYPKGGWIIVNVPEQTNVNYHQYITNTITGASTKFVGWNCSCFGVLGDNLFMGMEGLYKADSGLDDDGSDIALSAKQAFTNLGIPNPKKISNIRMYLSSDGLLNITVSLGFDFGIAYPQSVQPSMAVGAEWDVAAWDVAQWASTQARRITFTTSGTGVFVSMSNLFQIQGQQINWYASTYNFDIAKAF